MIKKQWVAAVVLLLLIPLVWVLGGVLFSLINPEIAAGHPNYVRNYALLDLLKRLCIWVPAGIAALLWPGACLMVIRAKRRSALWLVLAALGPFGFAVLAMLNDGAAAEPGRYTRFVRSMNWFVRACYEACTFVIVWVLAYEAVALWRTMSIWYEAATTGVPVAQIVSIRDASGGMWAFTEGLEEMFLVVFLYLLRPIVFALVGHVAASWALRKAR